MGSYTSQTSTNRRTGLAAKEKLLGHADLHLKNESGYERFAYVVQVTGEFTYVPDNAKKVGKGVVQGTLKPGESHQFGYTGLISQIRRRKSLGSWADFQILPKSARKDGADRVENGSGGGTGWEGPGSGPGPNSGNGSENGSDSKSDSGSDKSSPAPTTQAGVGVSTWARNNPMKATLLGAGLLGGGWYLMGD